MTPEQINIAIAEHLGWTGCWIKPMAEKHWQCSDKPEFIRHGSPPHAGSCTFPDYHGDLNAMHEAEVWLLTDDPHAYSCYHIDAVENHPSAISMEASERAELFLRIIGKWKEQV